MSFWFTTIFITTCRLIKVPFASLRKLSAVNQTRCQDNVRIKWSKVVQISKPNQQYRYLSFYIVFVRNCFKFSRITSLQKLVDILEEDQHSPFVSVQPWLILIDGTVSTIFRVTVLCKTACSFENSGNIWFVFL